MDSSLILEYIWTMLILIGLEGLLSADNALVLAVMVKHLSGTQKKRALNLGITMAFIFRIIAIFLITFIADLWMVQAIGAAYLMYMGGSHVYQNLFKSEKDDNYDKVNKQASFWTTAAKIGVADIAFAIDSILAAVALAYSLPDLPLPNFGGMNGGKFAVVVLASVAGLIFIKFAADWFVKLLAYRPGLETTAYLIVAWVGVKLSVITLAHEDVGVLPEYFPHSIGWTVVFWGVLLGTAVIGWFVSGKGDSNNQNNVGSHLQ